MTDEHETLAQMWGAAQFEPAIRHVRFPSLKNLRPGLQIDFEHPITVLVGPNGTNKTTILRALQGCPDYYNLGLYWYATRLDPIEENPPRGRTRFIHGRWSESASEVVEIIKTRIRRKDNPDYFEPSRPIQQDGMLVMPQIAKGEQPAPDRVLTRWKAIDKAVTYLDFRAELSAYDKFMNHAFYRSMHASHAQRKNAVRKASAHLRDSLESGRAEHIFNRRNRIIRRAESLQSEALKAIGTILGREYSSIKTIRHTYFGNVEGETVLLQSIGLEYSEAFAGSGEFAVVMLVDKILKSPRKSLILLDEPEVSLHPGAQRKLMDFLIAQTKVAHHQVVISTHSPEIVAELPDRAIKVLQVNPSDGVVEHISRRTSAADAFFRLGVEIHQTLTVYVEDRLARALVRKAMKTAGRALDAQVKVTVLPGGGDEIRQHFAPTFALSNEARSFILLDGDKTPSGEVAESSSLVDAQLDDAVRHRLGGQVRLSLDGHRGATRQSDKYAQWRMILTWAESYLEYLPCLTPEQFIADSIGLPGGGEKTYWVERTHKALGRAEWESPTSDEIFAEQERALAEIDDEHPVLVQICDRIRAMVDSVSGARR